MENNAPTNSAAVSDVARSDGQLPAQFSSDATAAAPGTSQQISPAATAYPSEAEVLNQAAALKAQTQPPVGVPPSVPSPVVTVPQAPPAPQLPAAPQNPVTTTANMGQPPAGIPNRAGTPPNAPAVPQNTSVAQLEAKVNYIGDTVDKLANVVATLAHSMQTPQPTPAAPVNGSNTGNQVPVMPGTGAPLAPQPHLPNNPVTATPPDPNAPVIPKPNPNNPGNTGVGVRTYVETEEDKALNDNDWIEKHFTLRDLSIDQMALALRWDPVEVIQVLKDRGYQFPDGV